jgi:biopolymer transport protein ExbB
MQTWSLKLRCLVGIAGLLFAAIALQESGGSFWATPAFAQGVDAADEAGPAPLAEPAQKSMLAFYFNALGWRYTIAFFFLSFCLVALVVMNFLSIRRQSIVPPELIATFDHLLNEKRWNEAYELVKRDESFLGKVLTAGLEKVTVGYPQAIEAMQEVGEDEAMKLEHKLNYIALIGTISPMVGLLGTVDGMVQAFRVIAESNTTPKPSKLADGISMALITTLVGLLLAIPAIAIFGIFRNLLSRLVLEVGIHSERLMSRFQNVNVKKS